MRKAAIIGTMALAVLGAVNGQGAEAQGHRVTVYVQDQQVANPLLLARAKALTTSMFAGIGVHLRWELGGRPRGRAGQATPDAEVVVRLVTKTPVGFHPGAPAYSLPYAPPSEVRVIIFYDRVLGPVVGGVNVGAAFLGHILAHEIAHVLQGITRHSEEGVMKAQWTPQDRLQMRKGPLPFTPHDAELIQDAMARQQGAVQVASR